MRIQVNLASRPFVELRPFFLRLRIIMGVLAVVGIGVAIGSHYAQKKLKIAEHQMNVLQERTEAAQNEKMTNERRMRQPQNAQVLDRAHFLNALFLRKSFSWTAVMMDLETVLPGGVLVTSLEPQVTSDGGVIMHLRVSGDRDKAVLLVRNLERSKRFLLPRIISETTQAKDKTLVLANGAPPGVEFEILADYNPIPEGEAINEKAAAKDTTKSAAKSPKSGKTAVPPARIGAVPPKPAGKYPKDGVVLKPYGTTPNGAKGGVR